MPLGTTRINYLNALPDRPGRIWNVAVGCKRGCDYCWARKCAKRFARFCELCGTFTPHVHPDRLDDVTPRQRPYVVGLGFMCDLFGGWTWNVPGHTTWTTRDIGPVLARHAHACPQHTFVTPTKYPENIPPGDHPENWWLLVTCTNQAEADARIPAARVSGFKNVVLNLEPWRDGRPRLPGDWADAWFDLDYRDADGGGHCVRQDIRGVILGGQSGPGAPPLDIDAARSVRDQCAEASIPFFMKQVSDSQKRDWPVRLTPQGYELPVLDGRVHNDVPWR